MLVAPCFVCRTLQLQDIQRSVSFVRKTVCVCRSEVLILNRIRSGAAIVMAWSLLALPCTAQGGDYEAPPVLLAKDVAADIALTGENYQIGDTVQTDGFMAKVVISSPFGEFTASGPGMLATRLSELQALAVLQHIEQNEQFKTAAQQQARDTAGNLRRFVDSPKETLQGVPEGVGRFFNRTGRSVRTGLQKLGDVRQGRMPGVSPETTSSLPGGIDETAALPDESFAETVARTGGDVAVNILGFDKQRRRLAKELGVDPYTTNQVLAKKLDDVTWSAFAGGLGVNVLTTMIPGGFVLSTSSKLSDWVWDTAPGDLRVAIEAQLSEIGLKQQDIDRFLRHGFYTLSMQGVLTGALEQLGDVEGRAEIFELVLNVGSEGQARFVVQTIDMLRNYHNDVEPLSSLRLLGTIIGVNEAGAQIVVAPVDYLSWSEMLDGFAGRLAGNDVPVEFYISGFATERTLNELLERGHVLEEATVLAPTAYPIQ